MKKIIVDYKMGMNLESLKKNPFVFGVILNSIDYSLNPSDSFSKDELLSFNALLKEEGFKTLLNVDQIIREKDIDSFVSFLTEVNSEFDYILFSDMAVLEVVTDKKRLIYYPKTLVSSTNEVSVYNKLGINPIIANELSLEEIVEIDNSGLNYSIEALGFHQMFYSGRKLLSLYNDYFKLGVDTKDKPFLIKEEIRNEFYPIYEFNKGTLIYTDYCYYLFNELKDLRNVSFIYLNGSFLNECDYLKIINLYNRLLSGENNLEEELLKLNYKFDKGFLKKKSVLLKEAEDE